MPVLFQAKIREREELKFLSVLRADFTNETEHDQHIKTAFKSCANIPY